MALSTFEDGDAVYCGLRPPYYGEKPFWAGNVFSNAIPSLMTQYITFSLISKLIHWVIGRANQTKFVSNMLAAVIMGHTVMGQSEYLWWRIFPTTHLTPRNTMGAMGISLYVFVNAVKIDYGYTISRERKKAFFVGVPSSVITFVVLMLSMVYIRGHVWPNFCAGYSDSISSIAYHMGFGSVLNIVATLSELNLMSSEKHRFAIAAMMMADITHWIYVSLGVLLNAEAYSLWIRLCLGMAEVLSIVICMCVLRPYVERIIKKTPKDNPEFESHVVTNFIVGAFVMQMIGLSVSGNSLAGIILLGLAIPSGPPLGSALVKRIELVAEEIFLPFYYIQLADEMTSLSLLIHSPTLYHIGIVVIMGFCFKFLVALLLSRFCCGFNSRDSKTIALMLNCSGIIMPFKFMRLRKSRYITTQVFTSLVISSVLLQSILSLFIKKRHQDDAQSTADHNDKATNPPQSIQTSRADPEFRVITCVHHESNVASITNLLEISNLSTKNVSCSVCAYVIHMGKLEGQTTPVFGPHFNHSRICDHNGCHNILSAFNNYTRLSKEQVIVLPFTSISPYKTMHEEICKLATDKDVSLIILPFYNNNNSDDPDVAIGLKSVYLRMQRHAFCTVGILLHKSPHQYSFPLIMKSGRHSSLTNYNAVVIFIGGADDREGLAYGLRMMGHSGLYLSVLHIQMPQNEYHHDDEDMILIDEFKMKSELTDKAAYFDIVVEDWGMAMEAIRYFVHEYHLVIVGQRRQGSSSSWLQQEMMDWVENPELGLIGDMLASSDFGSKLTSLLVLHHHGEVDDESSAKIEGESHNRGVLSLPFKSCYTIDSKNIKDFV